MFGQRGIARSGYIRLAVSAGFAVLTAVLGFQPGMYATPQVPPPRGPRAEIRFTASGHRVTGFAVGVLNAPCRGPIHFFGVGILNRRGPSTFGVRKLQWTARRGL